MDEQQSKRNIQAIFRLNNALIKEKNRKMAKYNLTSIQADVLLYIMQNSSEREVNQLDLQSEFKLTNPTVSGIIDRLESKNFVKRVRSGHDARFRRLELLEKGIALHNELLDNSTEAEMELLAELSQKEKAEFERLLWIVLHSSEKE